MYVVINGDKEQKIGASRTVLIHLKTTLLNNIRCRVVYLIYLITLDSVLHIKLGIFHFTYFTINTRQATITTVIANT